MEIPGAVKRREKAMARRRRRRRAGLRRKEDARKRGETRSGEAAFPLPGGLTKVHRSLRDSRLSITRPARRKCEQPSRIGDDVNITGSLAGEHVRAGARRVVLPRTDQPKTP